jgi:ribosome-binding protein aMBF1 (putative translation factor)
MKRRLIGISKYAFCRFMVTDFIERVRAALRQPGVTPAGLAKRAELHRNTLYGADKEGWNPTASVLTRLEPHIEAIERGEWVEPPAEDGPEEQAAA